MKLIDFFFFPDLVDLVVVVVVAISVVHVASLVAAMAVVSAEGLAVECHVKIEADLIADGKQNKFVFAFFFRFYY